MPTIAGSMELFRAQGNLPDLLRSLWLLGDHSVAGTMGIHISERGLTRSLSHVWQTGYGRTLSATDSSDGIHSP